MEAENCGRMNGLIGIFQVNYGKKHANIKQKDGIITKFHERIPDTKINKHHFSSKLGGSF